jgi:hypothetical protein
MQQFNIVSADTIKRNRRLTTELRLKNFWAIHRLRARHWHRNASTIIDSVIFSLAKPR